MLKTVLQLSLMLTIIVNYTSSMEKERQLLSQNLNRVEDLRERDKKEHSLHHESELATIRAFIELEDSDIESITLDPTAQVFFNSVKDDPSAGQEDKYNAYKQAVYMTKLKSIEDKKNKLQNPQDKKYSILKLFDNNYILYTGMIAGAYFFI